MQQTIYHDIRQQKRDVLSENSACATFLPIVLSWFNGLSVFSHLVYLSNTSNDLRPAKRTYKQNLLRPHHLLTSKVRKLLLKVMHYNIALLPKKVTLRYLLFKYEQGLIVFNTRRLYL